MNEHGPTNASSKADSSSEVDSDCHDPGRSVLDRYEIVKANLARKEARAQKSNGSLISTPSRPTSSHLSPSMASARRSCRSPSANHASADNVSHKKASTAGKIGSISDVLYVESQRALAPDESTIDDRDTLTKESWHRGEPRRRISWNPQSRSRTERTNVDGTESE